LFQAVCVNIISIVLYYVFIAL